MNNGVDLYFLNLKEFLRGDHPGPPQGGQPPQNIEKNVLGHVTYQMKALEKLYSNMSIMFIQFSRRATLDPPRGGRVTPQKG